jgi:hypothetical protein
MIAVLVRDLKLSGLEKMQHMKQLRRNIVGRQKKLEKAIKEDYGLKLRDVSKGYVIHY